MRHATLTAASLAAALVLAGAPAGAQTSAEPSAGDPANAAGHGAAATHTAAPSPQPDPRSDQPGHSQMLTPEEEQEIARILVGQGVPTDTAGIADVRPGAVIPRTTTMRPLPEEVVEIAPGYAGYAVVGIQGRICIVDPQTLVIIAVLPAA